MSYKTLKTVFHANTETLWQEEEKSRRNSPSAIHWPDFKVGNYSLFCIVTPQILSLSESIRQINKEVEKIWANLPNGAKTHFLDSMIIEEIQSTNEIESVYSSREEIFAALVKTQIPNNRSRFTEIAKLYNCLLGTTIDAQKNKCATTLEDIRYFYDAVTDGEIESNNAPDGKLFRSHNVVITSGQKTIHSANFSEEEISKRLTIMLTNAKNYNISPLLRTVISHFMFEYVHPFYDGNGRTGRYLLSADISVNLSIIGWLLLTPTIANNKKRYYDAFSSVENKLNCGEATEFIIEMLTLIKEAQSNLYEKLKEQYILLTKAGEEITKLIKGNDLKLDSDTYKLLSIFAQVHLFTFNRTIDLTELAKEYQKSKQIVRKYTKKLEEAGIIETISRKPLRFQLNQKGCELLKIEEDKFF
ncbi:Fic family protein [Actinomycetaceae bacterium TAE3-ERU4]|nr:Fic family protein [Actinomycetaceae bacterium TAE3-ERU4]